MLFETFRLTIEESCRSVFATANLIVNIRKAESHKKSLIFFLPGLCLSNCGTVT